MPVTNSMKTLKVSLFLLTLVKKKRTPNSFANTLAFVSTSVLDFPNFNPRYTNFIKTRKTFSIIFSNVTHAVQSIVNCLNSMKIA